MVGTSFWGFESSSTTAAVLMVAESTGGYSSAFVQSSNASLTKPKNFKDHKPNTYLAVCLVPGKVVQSRSAIGFKLSIGFCLQQPLLQPFFFNHHDAKKTRSVYDLP